VYLVTGATGNVGGQLARILYAGGHKVRVLVRDPARAVDLPERIERVVGDLDRPETLPNAFERVERVFLMAVGHGTEHTTNAVTAAKQAGVGLIVNLSSMGVTLDPMPVIGRWHADRDAVVKASGIAATFLCPSTLMTNALGWAPSIRAEGLVRDPIGPGRLSSIDPDDVAAVAAVALTADGHAGRSYVLTGRELLTVKEQTQILSSVLGRPIGYVEQTPQQASEEMIARGAPGSLAAAARELNELFWTDRIAFLTDEMRRLTGRQPATFEDWCRRHAPAFT
jgi:uncharacterized protein YbjT (DUF2867 family)